MAFRVVNQGAYAALEICLNKGQNVKAESDAMFTHSEFVTIEGSLDGGIFSALFRSFFFAESVFLQVMKASKDDQSVVLAPNEDGDITILDLVADDSYVVNKGAFLACEPSVQTTYYVQNFMKGFFSKTGFVLMRISGPGRLALCATGGIIVYNLQPDEVRIVDNGHVVAWTESMQYHLVKSSKSWVSSATSGEMLVCRFRGPGKVVVQTRKQQGNKHSGKSGGKSSASSIVAVLFWAGLFVFAAFIFILAILALVGWLQGKLLQGNLDTGIVGSGTHKYSQPFAMNSKNIPTK